MEHRRWMDGDGWSASGVQCSGDIEKVFFFSSFFSFARIMDSKGSLKATAKVSLWSGSRAENVVDPRFVGADETLTKPDVCSIPLSYVAICAPRSRSIERVSRACVSRVQKFAAEQSVASHGHAWMHIHTVLARVLNSPAP